MRIAFLGKGGSGKTTIAAAFTSYLANRFPSVLAIDADVNVHLGDALGIPNVPRALGGAFEEIASYVRGERSDLGDRPLISTTPPAEGSRFLMPRREDPLLSRFIQMKDAVNLIAVGTFSEGDVGSNCYHTKLHSLILVLNHLLDGVEDRVVVDATAGVDTLSTSLMVAYDLKVFIVEPTLKSVSVFRDYLQLAPQWTNRVFVIGNKVHDGSDLTFLEETIGRERLLGAVPFLPTIRRIEQGSKDALDGALNELQPLFDKLDRKLLLVGRDWTEYLSTLRTIHAQNCQWWYNDFYGCSLEEGLDSSFSYQAITSKAI